MNNIKKISNPQQIFSIHYAIEKMTITAISKKYKVSPKIISEILQNAGIYVKNPNKSNSGSKKKYTVNSNYFKIIDTEVKAWILGFIYADGYITDCNKVGITLKLSDVNILKRIKQEVSSTYPLTYHKARYSKDYKYTKKCRFLINDLKWFNDLKKLGCLERKSNILTFPMFLKKELIVHFIRGYFDGDGSVYAAYNKKKNWTNCAFSFIGTYEFISKLVEYLPFKFNGKLYKEKRTIKNVWEFKTAGLKRSLIFYNWLYENSTIYLQRKKEKFEEILKIDVQRL